MGRIYSAIITDRKIVYHTSGFYIPQLSAIEMFYLDEFLIHRIHVSVN